MRLLHRDERGEGHDLLYHRDCWFALLDVCSHGTELSHEHEQVEHEPEAEQADG